MITVKLFGLLRLETGIKEQKLDASSIKEVLQHLQDSGIPKEKLHGCVIFVNGESANKRKSLTDGDTVVLMPPVAGG